MTPFRSAAKFLWIVLAVVPSRSHALTAQDTTLTRADTAAAAAQDTLTGDTLLQFLPIPAEEVAAGPLPPGSRYVFTRDSMNWSYAVTLSDLLASIPGVYVERGGFIGQPEYINYGGRGPISIEMYWDGFLVEPMGGDTVYVDPSIIRLSYIRRVDVEIQPSMLRINLVSERRSEVEPRSVVRITSGSFRTAQYAGLFQKHWRNGVSLDVAGDFLGSEGAPGVDRVDRTLDLWAKLSWTPSPKIGAVYQIRFQDQNRDIYGVSEEVSTPPQDGNRTDYFLSMFAATRDDGWGLRVSGGLGSTSWGSDSVIGDQNVRQVFGAVQYSLPYLNLETRARMWDARNKWSVSARVNWMPVTGVVLGGFGRTTSNEGARTSRVATGTLGLYRGPFSLVGDISYRDGVQAPALLTDSAQLTNDASVRFGLDTKRLSGHIGLARREAFLPLPPLAYQFISSMDSSVEETYLIADVTLRPVQPIAITGWYSNPRVRAPDLQPPKHGRAEFTFRSKFMRTFRSGIFDFKFQYAIEYWSAGTAGFDALGTQIVLPGATFHLIFAQFQLVDFKIWWSLRNSRNTTAVFVPGLPYPGNAQVFGVRWEFFN